MTNGARTIGLEYRREGEQWVLVKATADEEMTALLGKEIVHVAPASTHPHHLQVRTILDALEKKGLGGGSIFEKVCVSAYSVEIEVKAKPHKVSGQKSG